MEFCLKRMNIASFDTCFQKEVLQISKQVEEVIYFKPAFIEKTQEIIVERGNNEFTNDDRSKFEQSFKDNMRGFFIYHQLYQKFGVEIHFLDKNTFNFAVVFERNKTETFLKDVDKLTYLNAKVSVFCKTYV